MNPAVSANLIGQLSPLRRYWLPAGVSLAILSAILLPLNLLTTQRLHHDEALYATWALKIASGDDPWLTDTPVDKPPLFLYTLAGVTRLLGLTEAATRIPSLLATSLIVFFTFWIGCKLYGNGVGLLAAWLVALSPFSLLFAPTAFTDPMLVALVLAGYLAAVHNRAGWAGICLGLAIATKQQGVLFVPLAIALLVTNGNRRGASDRSWSSEIVPQLAVTRQPASCVNHLLSPIMHHLLRFTHYAVRTTRPFFLTLLLTLLPTLIWDITRNQPSSYFEQSLDNYGGLSVGIIGFSERWSGFIDFLTYGTASPILNTIFLVGCPLLLVHGVWQVVGREGRGEWGVRREDMPVRMAQTDWLFFLFILAFLLLHVLLSFQIWDRYLLGLIPLLGLLLARVLLLPASLLKTHWSYIRPTLSLPLNVVVGFGLIVLLAVTLSGSVQDATNARYPLGSNSHALRGIEQIAAYLQGNIGADNTLYHHYLGTHWRFYLWKYPYDLQYWDSPNELVTKAQPGQLIAYPSWRSDTELRLTLFKAGLTLHELIRAYTPGGAPSIILYRIEAGP
jgi:hypothetical protein